MTNDAEEIFWKKRIKYREEHGTQKLRFIGRKFLAYLIAARMTVIPVVITFFLLGEWYSIGSFSLHPSILIILFLICFQFVHGLTNMAFDKKLDIFSRKPIIYVFKYISLKEMLITSTILSIIGLTILWYLNLSVFIIGFILLLITIVYAGPPIRLKTIPPFDSIANALEFGTLPFFLGWIATGNPLTSTSIIFGIIMGFPAVTYYFIISWHDIKSDRKFGIETSCTKLGHDGTIYAGIIIWVVLLVLSIIFFGLYSLITITSIACFPFILATKISLKNTSDWKIRTMSLHFFSGILVLIWLDFILLALSIWTFSIIPLTIFIIVVLYHHFFHLKFYLDFGKKIYFSLKKMS